MVGPLTADPEEIESARRFVS